MKLKTIIFEMALSKPDDFIRKIVKTLSGLSVDEIKEKFAGKEIGSGSFKVVYDLGGKYVLKVSEEETSEIKQEIDVKTCASNKFLTKIFAYDTENYTWIITEKVTSLKPKDTEWFVSQLKDLLEGSSFMDTEQWIMHSFSSEEEKFENRELEGELFVASFLEYLIAQKRTLTGVKSPWLKTLVSTIRKCDINPGDLYIKNWGKRLDGSLVILDYGYAKQW
jgi:hypothetical protein